MGFESSAATLALVCPMLCVAFMGALFVAGLLGMPFLYAGKIRRWTEGRTPQEAFDALDEGATRGFIQIRPASYVYEEFFTTKTPAAKVLANTVHRYSLLLGRVLAQDDTGVVVSEQFPPRVGLGWVGVVLVQDKPDGTEVRARFRSTHTFLIPVLTFFLSLQLRIHLRRVLDQP